MIKNKYLIPFVTTLLLTGTLSAKEAPREFSLSTLLSGFDTTIELRQALTPKELIKPVSLESNGDFEMPSIFHYLWI